MKLTVEERVRMLLSLMPYYEERQYSGNYYDNDDLNDIRNAIERAALTDIQHKVINLTFIEDLTHLEAARKFGVSRQAITTHERKAVTRISEAYEKGNNDEFNRA